MRVMIAQSLRDDDFILVTENKTYIWKDAIIEVIESLFHNRLWPADDSSSTIDDWKNNLTKNQMTLVYEGTDQDLRHNHPELLI